MPHIVCRRCRNPLTANLARAAPVGDPDTPGSPIMAAGTYATGPGNTYVLNPVDLTGAVRHHRRGRLNGCCDLDGMDGPNLICGGCGTDVATQESDCWQAAIAATVPHATEAISGDRTR